MNQVTELVRERVGIIVTRGLDSYGYFPVEEDKLKYYDVAVDQVLTVTGRIETGEVISVIPIKPVIVSGVFTLGFDQQKTAELTELVFQNLYREVEGSGLVDPDTIRTYRKYESLIVGVIGDLTGLLSTGLEEYLSGIDQYGVSETVVNLPITRSRLVAGNRGALSESSYQFRLPVRFRSVFDRNVSARADVVSGSARDINGTTSDSKLNAELPVIDESLLVATFAGEGAKIYEDIKSLYQSSVEFGGYDGSITGSIEYQARYHEYLMAMSYGKRLPGGVLSGEFGRFEDIYDVRVTDTLVPGLKFLEPMSLTRSGNQDTMVGNPVAKRYGAGLSDRYLTPPGTDYVSLILESVYVLCLRVGDSVRSLLNRELEGIGNTRVHFNALSRVFPASSDVRDRSTGFTGAIKGLLSANRALHALLGYEPELNDITGRLNSMAGLIESLTSTIRSAGFRPGHFVPSLALTIYEPDRELIAQKLGRIGFDSAEVQEIMSMGSMEELVSRFAPLTDSQDVVSFFRAYDLTKLLYEFGGQTAVDQYTDFLYGVNPDTAILRLLELLEKGRSLTSRVRGSEFSRLIGYVVTLTYAVDPAQLSTLDSILRRNNLDLFESITQLVEGGFSTVIKDRDSVSLLSGIIAQMVTLDNSGYEDQKPLWNDLIERSAGNVGTGVSGLYSKTDGITPTELYASLGGPSATSPLGKILDGVRGGRMTSLLRYCNMFGLLYILSGYRNSGQLINESADRYTAVLDLLDTMETLARGLRVAELVLGETVTPLADPADPVVLVQNKEFSAMIDLVGGRGSGPYPIAESPGIGNSRIPNGIRIGGSLTPEEASIVSSTGAGLGVFTRSSGNPTESGSYIRIAVSNLLASGVRVGEGAEVGVGATPTDAVTESPIPDYVTRYGDSQPEVGSPDPLSNVPRFDPVESCRRFGGTDCVEPDPLCSKPFNRALYPESGYGTDGVPGVTNVPIDRPLGSELAGTVTWNTVPFSHPQLPFTANGLSRLSRSNVLKDSEMSCASLKDPYQYGACMSMLKCKKFNPPYEGRYSFAFCPSTLHGGRLRK